MPCRVETDINQVRRLLPPGYVRPSKPIATECAKLYYDCGIDAPTSCYMGGYSKSTAESDPYCWRKSTAVKKLLETRGISQDIIRMETVQDAERILRDLRRDIDAAEIEQKNVLLGTYRNYLELRCRVGGVPMNHTQLSPAKDTKTNRVDPFRFIVEMAKPPDEITDEK